MARIEVLLSKITPPKASWVCNVKGNGIGEEKGSWDGVRGVWSTSVSPGKAGMDE